MHSQRLLERLKFLAIFASNLDEFFQVRVAGLQEQRDAGVGPATPEGLTPDEQLAGIRERVVELSSRADALWSDELRPELEKERLRIIDWKELDERDRGHLESLFRERVFPVLTPLSVDPAHPFPYISSLSLNLAALVRDPCQRRAPLRPREGTAVAPAVRRAPGRRAVRPHRAGHRCPPRGPLPRDGDRGALRLPAHEGCRLRAGRGRGWGPLGGDRVGAPSPAPGGDSRAARGRRGGERGGQDAPDARARSAAGRGVPRPRDCSIHRPCGPSTTGTVRSSRTSRGRR